MTVSSTSNWSIKLAVGVLKGIRKEGQGQGSKRTVRKLLVGGFIIEKNHMEINNLAL